MYNLCQKNLIFKWLLGCPGISQAAAEVLHLQLPWDLPPQVGWRLHGAWWLHVVKHESPTWLSFTGPHWQQSHLAFFHGFPFFLCNQSQLRDRHPPSRRRCPCRLDLLSSLLCAFVCPLWMVFFSIFASALQEWLILGKINKEARNKIGGLLWGSLPEQQKPMKTYKTCRFAVFIALPHRVFLFEGLYISQKWS